MNANLVLGIVLLALTGIVSAETAGKADLSGDVHIPPTLELTTSGSITNWVLEPDSLSYNAKTGVTITVTSNGNVDGYHVSVADKLDPLQTGGVSKPAGTAGHMSTYCGSDPTDYCGVGKLTNPVEIDDFSFDPEGSYFVHVWVSGADQELYHNNYEQYGVPVNYTPTFEQIVGPDDKPARWYGSTGYRIILTFTATPN